MPPALKRLLTGKPPTPTQTLTPNTGVGAPPPELNDEEREVWRQVASTAPHLTPMDRLNLAALAIHTARGRQYDAVVACDGLWQRDADQGGHKRIHPAVKQSKVEAQFVAELSARLKLTPQAPAPATPQQQTVVEDGLEKMLRELDERDMRDLARIERGEPPMEQLFIEAPDKPLDS
jgi:phage terminase small subunit